MPLFFLLCLIILANGQLQTSSCLYLQHVTLQGATNITTDSSYNFSITWTSPQTDLGAGGLVFGGFYIQEDYCYPSYGASLVNQTSTGAAIAFTNQALLTEVVFMQFDIVFGKASCSSHLEVVTQKFFTTSFNQVPPRSGDEQDYQLSHSSVPASATLKIYVYFHAIDVLWVNAAQALDIAIKTTSNQNNGSFIVTVQSPAASKNQITSITFTAIVVEESGFPSPIFSDELSYNSFGVDTVQSITHSFSTADLNHSTAPSEQCVVGLYDMLGRQHFHIYNPKALFRSFSGFNVEYTSKEYYVARNRITCILECDPAYQLDTDNNPPYHCYLCSSEIPGCMICNSKSVCNQTCPVANCTACDKQGNCQTCSSESAYRSDICQCSDDPFCITCINTTTCSSCRTGSFLNSIYCQNCSEVFPNCAQCVSATNCSVCASGYTFNSTFGCQACSQAISDCLTCSSASVCSVCASNHFLNNANTTCDMCAISNCQTCSTLSTCGACETGYAPSSGNTSCEVVASSSSQESEGGGVSMGVVGGAVGGAVACAIVGVIIYKAAQASKVAAATTVMPEPSLVQDKIFVEGKSNAVANSTAEKLQVIASTQVIDI